MRDIFEDKLLAYFPLLYKSLLSDNAHDWAVKGFIDSRRNIYRISLDTKVISKLIEIMFIPLIYKFAEENNFTLVLF
jgi:hypothetical protein